jgi:hypothetical protein
MVHRSDLIRCVTVTCGFHTGDALFVIKTHHLSRFRRFSFVSPHYVKLWLRVIPGYKKLEEYVHDYGSPNTSSKHYPVEQVDVQRAGKIPGRVVKSFRAQL